MDLKIGNYFKVDSGLGGSFKVQYTGKRDGKYVFDNVSPDFEQKEYLTLSFAEMVSQIQNL